MNLEFFLPSNKNKPSTKKKVCIPANIIENLLTNRQNRNMSEDNIYQQSDNVNTQLSINQEDKYTMVLKENQRLKEENQQLREMILAIKDENQKTQNDNKQSFADLLLSLSYEKQEESNCCYRNHSNDINLIDDSENNNSQNYCTTDGDLYFNNHNNSSNHNYIHSQKANCELMNIMQRTKNILHKYQSNFLNNKTNR